ncbi:nuclear pore glycoprotein p62-like [Periplaneta americana]|uniref:nuclear pore glycoprotein p62-like n=1 Tax=Periplaneta americana TaxID=6978 RepID=UPI0037E7A179
MAEFSSSCPENMKKKVSFKEQVEVLGEPSQNSSKLFEDTTQISGISSTQKMACKCKSKTSLQDKTHSIFLPVNINFHYFDELMNRWYRDLQEDETTFLNQTREINERFKIIMNNQEKINMLHGFVQTIAQNMHTIEKDLEFIYCQHRELDYFLIPLEEYYNKIENIDLQRCPIYNTTELMYTDMIRLTEDLTELILHFNAMKENRPQNEMEKLTNILNCQINTLYSIDQKINILDKEVQLVDKLQKTFNKI